jgi:hypothetical protein
MVAWDETEEYGQRYDRFPSLLNVGLLVEVRVASHVFTISENK